MAQKSQQLNYQYVDRDDVQETFADTLEKLMFDGKTLRLEFCVHRMDAHQPPAPPGGKKYPICRLVLPADGLIDIYNKLNNIISAMEKKGLVKRGADQIVHEPPAGKPN